MNRFTITVTEEERDLLCDGLHTRACFIETGTVGLRSHDAAEAGQKVCPLSVSQMQIIISTEDLIARLRGLK